VEQEEGVEVLFLPSDAPGFYIPLYVSRSASVEGISLQALVREHLGHSPSCHELDYTLSSV
jgi:hypothetical protein